MGSIALPGAVVLANNDISASVKDLLITQLHINEAITGQEFDLRMAADPNYVKSIRALRQRLLVNRDLRETANRTEFDVVIFIRMAMVYIEQNCFGPTGSTFYLANIHWGQLGIFDTNINRTCKTNDTCGCGVVDGYAASPYYPARYDPMYPEENHLYNQIPSSHVFGNCGCAPSRTKVLCRKYYYDTRQKMMIPVSGCRTVR